MLVVDASVIVKLVVNEPGTDIAREIVTRHDDCIAPDLLTIEVASALAKKVRFAGLPRSAAIAGLDGFSTFLAEIIDTTLLLGDAVAWSITLNHSLFDCTYLALAIERDCAVLTADQKFAASAIAAGYEANIELLR